MIFRYLLLAGCLVFTAGCGVKGAPMPRKDELFIKPSIRGGAVSETQVNQEENKKELIIKKEVR